MSDRCWCCNRLIECDRFCNDCRGCDYPKSCNVQMEEAFTEVECRICGERANPDDGLCFQCWVRRDKAEAEYIGAFTRGGTR